MTVFSIQIEAEDKPAYTKWPPAVRQAQRLAETEHEVVDDYQVIRSYLPDQHRDFHSHNISFLPLATKDDDGRIWASILAGADGVPGFIKSPDRHHLEIAVETWEGDPVRRTLSEADALVAGVGVELSSRRRNKLAGRTSKVEWNGRSLALGVKIHEALGNCPKYITVRQLTPHAPTNPSLTLENLSMSTTDRLPPSIVSFIQARDTLFLATSYLATPSTATEFPSHLGCNHRGGRPGFVRVRTDSRTLVLPDFSGNRHMTSLGNLISDRHAGMAFPDFETGDILYLTGEGRTLVGDEATAVMPRAKVITLLEVTGYTFVKDALPFRQDRALFEPSPYSPPVRYLAEEQEMATQTDVKARLKGVRFHSTKERAEDKEADLATFTFEASSPIKVKAGQYVVLDTLRLIGGVGYVHMARKGDEHSPNEDGVRTWTISSTPSTEAPSTFSITVRKLTRGRVSPRLFSFAVYCASKVKEGGRSYIPILEFPLLGIGGSFLPPSTPTKLLLIAGGIGITPFLSFLETIARQSNEGLAVGSTIWNVQLLVATREPTIILKLIHQALGSSPFPHQNLHISVHLFSPSLATLDFDFLPADVALERHEGRITPEALKEAAKMGTSEGGKVYLCGPPSFEESVMAGLKEAGVEAKDVARESFDF